MTYVQEGELPTTSLQTRIGIVGIEGAHLAIGDVQVTFPPGSLPTGATVTAMSQTLQDRFKVNGTVSLSPVVSIGPHNNPKLLKPAVVRLPLQDALDQTPPTVLVSHTSCYDDFSWEKVHDEDVSYDSGFVEICLSRCTTLYAQRNAKRAPSTVILKNDRLLFSVSKMEKGYREGCFMKVKFGSSEESIKPAGAYALAHSMEETREAAMQRIIPRSTVQATIQGKDELIWQCDTPFDNAWHKGQHLDEAFAINTRPKPCLESTDDGGGSGEEFYIWWIKPGFPGSTHAYGSLRVECVEADIVEQSGKESPSGSKMLPAPKALAFSFTWSDFEEDKSVKTG